MPAKQLTRPFLERKFLWLAGFVLLINLVQAYGTTLLNDESYYWVYAKYLSWGYFDHPPMIALLIRIGASVLGGEIGVRLLPLLLGSGTFYLICKLIAGETEGELNLKLLALLLLSSLFLNLYSFLAIPDTPLLFFATLFLYIYRNYLNKDSFINAAVLGVVAALLLYSKYHGILVIGLTLISNPGLFKRRSFYVTTLVALVLYAPHIYWQIQHDFPTIRFQFGGRSGSIGIRHTLSYLGEQAAVTGPVILLLFSILYRPKDQFQKTLKYIVVGIFIFFLASSLKAMVNVHWTAVAWPPMLCLAYLYIEKLKAGTRFTYGLLIFNLLVVLVMRLNFGFNWFGVSNFNDKNPRLMASTLKAHTAGHPLVFDNTYNEPSYFSFYTGQDAFAVNDIWYKKTQYNYLPQLEQRFQDKAVAYVSDKAVDSTSRQIIIPHGKKYYITFINHFASFNSINVVFLSPINNLEANYESTFQIAINGVTPALMSQLKSESAYLVLSFTNNQTQATSYYKYPLPAVIVNNQPFKINFKAPARAGDYHYQFAVVAKQQIGIGYNSNVYNCRVN
ncbi:glycosyltransferase family 39 protein [Mucilaginibacter sp. dw_454]|uniref:ArnT family glycosyltransferase n=1 Tax=Mucilaginibacter sp. dw_454 TaxID=2720079 RepID=UPI001BD3B097|nr:glycosyltransferase family 39 protein [Mucilaginibacter sp. dw_454]